MLEHIKYCSSLIDISNFFILICSPDITTKDTVFSTLEINFTDCVTLPKTFCFNPWAHLEISSTGEFKPCCVYNESIKNSANRAYNINTDTIDEVYNSTYMNQLRKQFRNGEQPGGCSHCWYKEQHHGMSNRNWAETMFGINAHCLDIEKDSLDNLISLDIKLGNLCNFTCRICNAGSSSKIAEEQVNHFNSIINLKTLNAAGNWTANPQIWKMFEQVGNQLVNIDFYGGEPFLVKQHEIFLNYLIEHGYAEKIRLHYNSNGSIYPKHLLEKWKLFREVDIAFSIDNIGQRFELERGGSWDQVENNLNNFLKYKLSNMVLNIFTTVNVQNIYYLDELIDWVETKYFNALHFNMLKDPLYFRINAMGPDLTKLVVNKLTQISPDRLKKYSIYPIIESLKLSNNSDNLIDKLAEYMLKLDNIRDQKFIQTHPEIAQIIYKGK
jgi:MoaA/NifB/PqqE/SkfB family radical SAM enzyme